MKKIILIFTILFSLVAGIYAQESDVSFDDEHEFTKAEDFFEFIHSLDFIIQTEPGVYLNPESKLVSAPSPMIYPLTIGIIWPNYTVFSVQPTLSFFAMDYLLYENKVLPAEIENRTSTALSFLFNLPLVVSLYFPHSRLQFMPGVSLMARFGFLANNVNEQDYGFSGSAGEDIQKINQWFWSDMHYLYLSFGFSWLFDVYRTMKAGPVVNAYIPMSFIANGEGLQGTIFSAGLKISL